MCSFIIRVFNTVGRLIYLQPTNLYVRNQLSLNIIESIITFVEIIIIIRTTPNYVNDRLSLLVLEISRIDK